MVEFLIYIYIIYIYIYILDGPSNTSFSCSSTIPTLVAIAIIAIALVSLILLAYKLAEIFEKHAYCREFCRFAHFLANNYNAARYQALWPLPAVF